MGRQIAVAASFEDEVRLLQHLSETADIILIEAFAKTKDELWKTSFEPLKVGHFQYDIWNRAFSWIPEYNQVGSATYDPSKIGWYYVSNKNAAPLLEFCRTKDVQADDYGRIYWAKDFSSPHGLDYDVAKFSKWYDQVVRWVQKTSAGIRKMGTSNLYYLPDAWRLYEGVRRHSDGLPH